MTITGAQLRAARELIGLSQAALAVIVQYGTNGIASFEAGDGTFDARPRGRYGTLRRRPLSMPLVLGRRGQTPQAHASFERFDGSAVRMRRMQEGAFRLTCRGGVMALPRAIEFVLSLPNRLVD